MIPALEGRFDLYIHDSDHAMEFMLRELNLAHDLMQPNGIMIADDIDWSNAFHAFIIEHALYPLLLTDNGKDDLRVRTGVVDLAHPYIEMPAITGKTYAVR
jgi:predicted O-methyltransferase YrrM